MSENTTGGILSETDVKMLRGEAEEVGEHGQRQRRIRMRTRVRKAIAEFAFLFKNLPPEDRKHIFAPPHSSEVSPTNVAIGIEHMAAFAYLGMKHNTSHELAEQNLQTSVELAKQKLEAESKSDEIGELLNRHKNGEQLSTEEVGKLLNAAAMGTIEIDDHAELMPDE